MIGLIRRIFRRGAAKRAAAKTTPAEWERAILVYACGGPLSSAEPSQHELQQRGIDVPSLAAAFLKSGIFASLADAEATLAAARDRLISRGAAKEIPPPPGSWEKALPPEGWVMLTPNGCREAAQAWREERERVTR